MASHRRTIVLILSVSAIATSVLLAEEDVRIRALLSSPSMSSQNYAERAVAWLAVWNSATADDLPELTRAALEHQSTHARRVAVEVIGKLGEEGSLPVLCDILRNDRSHHVRRAAARALGTLGSPEAAPALANAMILDPVANNRKRAASSLSLVAPVASKEIMRRALATEKDASVLTAMEWAMNRPRGQSVLPLIQSGRVTSGICNGTRYLLYTPKGYRVTERYPVLVSVHGSDGTPGSYLNVCRNDADRYGIMIIAPWFDFATFDHWGSWSMRHLGMERADLRLLEILQAISETARIQEEQFFLYGHSQGGQFVQRFVLAHPHRVARAAAAAPGEIVLPDPDRGFPHGTQFNPFFPDLTDLDYGALVQAKMAVIVGEEDDQEHIDVAENLVATAERYAASHDIACNVELFIVPHHGHGGMSNYLGAARQFLFSQ